MYYICKFFDTWTFYDKDRSSSRLMDASEVKRIKGWFGALVENKNLLALHFTLVNPGKLVTIPAGNTNKAGAYYLCKFFDTWTLYDGSKATGRLMDQDEIPYIKTTFPVLQENRNLAALLATSVNPNKLMALPGSDQVKEPARLEKAKI